LLPYSRDKCSVLITSVQYTRSNAGRAVERRT